MVTPSRSTSRIARQGRNCDENMAWVEAAAEWKRNKLGRCHVGAVRVVRNADSPDMTSHEKNMPTGSP
eukprot:scaffold164870_cov30-Tisochrysis_lutea.AAC.3